MATALILGTLAASAAARSFPRAPNTTAEEPNAYTSTSASAVYAAQATAPSYSKSNGPYVNGTVFNRYVSIWLENTDFDKAAADPNLAWLASQGITLSNMFGVTHPSEPNYAAVVGGDNFGMDNDAFNQIASNVSSVVDLLEDRGISWASYQEGMPYSGYEGYAWVNQTTKANNYVRKHHPTVLFDKNTTPDRLSKQKNTTEFYKDLADENLPQWMFITPNMIDDGHDTSVTVAGSWTRNFLEPLLSNEYFMKDTLILVTFDETETYTIGNKVFSFLLGGALNGEVCNDTTYYNHYSEIATVEANWDLHTLGRFDVGANVFHYVAEKTGDVLRPYTAATGPGETIYQNSSFAGPFDTQFQWGPYPAPNLNITSPGAQKRTVLPAIKDFWGPLGLPSYYTSDVAIFDGQHPPSGYAVNDVTN